MPDPTTESLNYLGSDTDKMFAQVPDVYNEEVVPTDYLLPKLPLF